MRLESRVSRIGSLIAVFVAVLAAVMQPAPAAAQDCGFCYHHATRDAHRFSHNIHLDHHRCDNVGGCHKWTWYDGGCWTFHGYSWRDVPRDLESAMAESNPQDLSAILAGTDNWHYDPADRALSLTCSGWTVARYVLAKELADVVGTIASERPSTVDSVSAESVIAVRVSASR